jgi:hypothetical protein
MTIITYFNALQGLDKGAEYGYNTFVRFEDKVLAFFKTFKDSFKLLSSFLN